MKEAYRLTRKDGAPGIDGVGAADYATNLEANLLDLLDRIKSTSARSNSFAFLSGQTRTFTLLEELPA
jgi:hypothetical protein